VIFIDVMFNFEFEVICSDVMFQLDGRKYDITTARSVEDETRNAESNGTGIPEWWGDFSQL